MSMGTVMQTALSGMSAAAALVQVTANNVANAPTLGFKASRVQFGTQAPQSLSQGAPPDSATGGTNPRQVGSGVIVTGTAIDWSQGPLLADDQPGLLALEGEGLFILEGRAGEPVYTRAGHFTLNADGEVVAATGERLLGYGLNAAGDLQPGELTPLSIRLGSHVAGEGGRPAWLRSYSVDRNGRIVGRYSDGRQRTLGQISLARFTNPQGLAQRPGNKFQATPASGKPTISDPGQQGAAELRSGGREPSNVDVGRQLIDLTLAGNLFRANAAVFQTADTLLGELFFPYRR